jgi:hypothetical protein
MIEFIVLTLIAAWFFEGAYLKRRGLKRGMKYSTKIAIGLIALAALYRQFPLPYTWREEVLLHDGQIVIAKRSRTFLPFARDEWFRATDHLLSHSIEFTPPGGKESIKWVSEYDKKFDHPDFHLQAVDIVKSIPYVVAKPISCELHEKWGSPNPDFVIFKYVNRKWQRIALEDWPTEINRRNVSGLMLSQYERDQVDAAPNKILPASAINPSRHQFDRSKNIHSRNCSWSLTKEQINELIESESKKKTFNPISHTTQ